MITTTISQLKVNPSSVIAQAADYPVAVENRNKVQAYLIGKNLYERLMIFLEDAADAAAVKHTDFTKGKDFEKVAKELGI
jgi:antitoxin StbD